MNTLPESAELTHDKTHAEALQGDPAQQSLAEALAVA